MRLAKPELVSTIFAFSIIFSTGLSGCGLERLGKGPDDRERIDHLVVFKTALAKEKIASPQPFMNVPTVWTISKAGAGSAPEFYSMMLVDVVRDGENKDTTENYYGPENFPESQAVKHGFSKIFESGKVILPSCQFSYIVGLQKNGFKTPVLEGICRSKETGKLLELTLAPSEDEVVDLNTLALKEQFVQIVEDIR